MIEALPIVNILREVTISVFHNLQSLLILAIFVLFSTIRMYYVG